MYNDNLLNFSLNRYINSIGESFIVQNINVHFNGDI
jgi:hypothetical protein